MEFFDDILIPSYLLQTPSEYRPKLKQWIWKFGEDEQSSTEFQIQQGDQIRFRIRTITFASLTSTVKGTTATVTTETHAKAPGSNPEKTIELLGGSNGASNSASVEEDLPIPQPIRKRSTSFDLGKNTEPPAAMQIIGSINEDGLGVPAWWE